MLGYETTAPRPSPLGCAVLVSDFLCIFFAESDGPAKAGMVSKIARLDFACPKLPFSIQEDGGGVGRW